MRERVAAIALTDARIRFRRTSTVVVFPAPVGPRSPRTPPVSSRVTSRTP